MDKKKKYIIVISILAIVSVIGISYAFFNYYMKGTKNHQLIAGEVYLHLVEGTDTLSLTNVFPETKEEARSRTDNVITFNINGKNTTTNKDIYYEIMLNEGDAVTGKNRFNPKDLVFDLVEVINGEERMVIDAMSFSDINARRIWVNTVNRNTTTQLDITYKLRVWLSDKVIISDTESYANYTTDEFRNSYASVKVSVYGDFVEKSLPYNYLKRTGASLDLENPDYMPNFWPTSIDNVKSNIIEVNFLELDQNTIDTRYQNASIKEDVTDTTKGGNVKVWLEDAGNSQYKMYVASDGITIFPSDCDTMFLSFVNLTTINFGNINTSQVTDMSYMFGVCSSLTSLDVSSFDTSQVTDMSYMFGVCSSLTSLDVSSFDTSQVTDMSYMFGNCSSLTNLNLNNFNTSQVTTMNEMFYGCSSLTSLNLSNFDTSQVTTMEHMFNECSSLTSLDLNNFDTSQVTTMSNMFSHCRKLTNLNLNSFDTSKVTDMSYMFISCSILVNLDLSSFNTSMVTNMECMFAECKALSNLDISNFDTSKVTKVGAMFSNMQTTCRVLVHDVSMQNWVLTYSDHPSAWSTANVIIK